MRAAVERDTMTREIVITVKDGIELDVSETWHTRPRRIRVDTVTIRVLDGETLSIRAAGGLLLKDGRASDLQRGHKAWNHRNTTEYNNGIETAPEPIREMWRQAPAGITEYTWTAAELAGKQVA